MHHRLVIVVPEAILRQSNGLAAGSGPAHTCSSDIVECGWQHGCSMAEERGWSACCREKTPWLRCGSRAVTVVSSTTSEHRRLPSSRVSVTSATCVGILLGEERATF